MMSFYVLEAIEGIKAERKELLSDMSKIVSSFLSREPSFVCSRCGKLALIESCYGIRLSGSPMRPWRTPDLIGTAQTLPGKSSGRNPDIRWSQGSRWVQAWVLLNLDRRTLHPASGLPPRHGRERNPPTRASTCPSRNNSEGTRAPCPRPAQMECASSSGCDPGVRLDPR